MILIALNYPLSVPYLFFLSSPLNCDAGNMLREGDLRAFRSTARMLCDLYATKI